MIVLDASIVIKWLIDEGESNRSQRYLNDHVNGDKTVAVPELLFFELANVLATKSSLSPEEAALAFSGIWDLELEAYHLGINDYLRTMRLSQQLDISAYDATYVSLAEKLNVPLVTADRKLFRKCTDLGFVHGDVVN